MRLITKIVKKTQRYMKKSYSKIALFSYCVLLTTKNESTIFDFASKKCV